MAPATPAYFSFRQGQKCLLACDGSCPGSFILNAAGWKKLARQGGLLPRMLFSHSGRVREASWAGKTPAPDALFSMRQGGRSLPDRSGSCPGCSILIPAGWKKLARQAWLLPRMLYSQCGRVEEACQAERLLPHLLISHSGRGRNSCWPVMTFVKAFCHPETCASGACFHRKITVPMIFLQIKSHRDLFLFCTPRTRISRLRTRCTSPCSSV